MPAQVGPGAGRIGARAGRFDSFRDGLASVEDQGAAVGLGERLLEHVSAQSSGARGSCRVPAPVTPTVWTGVFFSRWIFSPRVAAAISSRGNLGVRSAWRRPLASW